MQSKAFQWIVGAAFLVLLILAGGWFLLVSNVFEQASSLHAEREDVQVSNEQIRLRNLALKADFERIDELRAELAELRMGIPTTPELDAVTDQVDAIAQEHGVTIVSSQVSQAVEVGTSLSAVLAEIAEASTPEQAPEPGPAAGGDDEATDETTARPATPIDQIDGLFSIPFIITIQGTYTDARAFLADVQTAIDRLYLAQTMTVTSLLESDGANGVPPNETGDVTLSVAGHLFVLTDPDPEVEGEPTGELPRGDGSYNPFRPVAGVDESDDESNENTSDDD